VTAAKRTNNAKVSATTRGDPHLLVIREFTELVAASARSARQRERVVRAARVPVTGAGLMALRTIERHGPIVVSDLARRLEVDQSTVSRQVRPLEEMALAQRATDPDDRRVSWLTITASGRKVLERVEEVMLNDFDVALSDWRDDDRALLAELLARFRDALLHTRTDDTGWSVRKDP
jgi:DNA-binding MarR family transcriptional regulator